MKFLCDQCKAKYQIADEKVVGKTVRMKCRKCGYNIEVKADIVETSLGSGAPSDPPAPAEPVARPAAAAPLASAPLPPQRLQPSPKVPLATRLASVRTPPPGSIKVDPGALASAFEKNASQPRKTDSGGLENLQSSSDWYVAINGVPVGPIRVGEIKAKVGAGGISEESLCWREGMEEWQPVRAVTELAAVVREARSMGRPSLTSAPPAGPPEPRPSLAAPAPSPAPAPALAAASPVAKSVPLKPATRPEPARPLAPAARSNVVALSSRLATAEKLDPVAADEDERTVVGGLFDPPAPPAPQLVRPAPSPPAALIAAAPPPSPAAQPVAAVVIDEAPVPTAASWQPLAPPRPSTLSQQTVLINAPRKQAPVLMIGMMVLFGTFGITAAIVLLTRGPAPQPTTVYLTQPGASAAVAEIPSTPAVASNEAPPTPVAVALVDPAPGKPAIGGGSVKPAASASAKAIDPKLAALLGGGAPAGPSMGGGSGGGSSGGGSLSNEDIQRVVASRASGVKRSCWERGGGTQSDVSVKVELTIGGNGGVSRASASGNDAVVAKCIENAVRGWTFPGSGGSTVVVVPFHFLRQ